MIAIDGSLNLADSVQFQDHFKPSQMEIFGSFATIIKRHGVIRISHIYFRSPLLDWWELDGYKSRDIPSLKAYGACL